MSKRITITYTCDQCGVVQSHEWIDSNQLGTLATSHNQPEPRDWSITVYSLTNVTHFCPACKVKL